MVNANVSNFLGGFSGAPGAGGPHDNPTGYIAPVDTAALGPKDSYEYEFHLVLGDLATIRSYAEQVVPHSA